MKTNKLGIIVISLLLGVLVFIGLSFNATYVPNNVPDYDVPAWRPTDYHNTLYERYQDQQRRDSFNTGPGISPRVLYGYPAPVKAFE